MKTRSNVFVVFFAYGNFQKKLFMYLDLQQRKRGCKYFDIFSSYFSAKIKLKGKRPMRYSFICDIPSFRSLSQTNVLLLSVASVYECYRGINTFTNVRVPNECMNV